MPAKSKTRTKSRVERGSNGSGSSVPAPTLTKHEKGSIEFGALVSADEAADYLEALAQSCREGSTLLESGDRSLVLEVGRDVKLELEAEADPAKGKGSIEISLSWRVAEQVETPPSLVIVAGAPDVAGGEDD
jgi:amphi-Trp domain-containing protein